MSFGHEHKTLFKGLHVDCNAPMDKFTNFRVGGPADLLGRPKSISELTAFVQTASQNNIPVTIVGGGSNTLVSDRGIRGLVIVLTKMKTGPKQIGTNSDNRVEALAGERLSTLCRFAADTGLSGLEWAAGIPGTLGGALVMNAGAHDSDMQAITSSIDIYDTEALACRTLDKDEIDFKYRKLNIPDSIIIKATLTLQPGTPKEITTQCEKNIRTKKIRQPVSMASGGCFFKNPSLDNPAGRLIQNAGLKGYKLGGAMVSDLHANFIINHDNARCRDILALKRLVQDRVYEKFGIRLEPEVKTIGQ